jgi:beta-N-acetylhexosaminidase
LIATAALTLTACASSPGGGPQAAEDGPSASRACTPAPLAERAAAVLTVGLPGVETADDPLAEQVMALGVGGVFLNHDNVVDAEQVTELLAGLRQRSPRPLAVSTDEESGRVAVTRKVVGAGPSPRRMAAQQSPEQVRAFAAELGGKLAALGVDVDLAPLLDLDDGPYSGVVGDRSFSADPQTATEYGLAFSRGLTDAGVQPTVKHFPGQGRSEADTHAEAAVVQAPLSELRSTDLLPFQEAIDAGAPVIMLNHLGYAALDPDLPASLSPQAYELLREMGFEGVAMTDSLGMGAVNLRWDFPEAAVRAIEAGADVALATDGRQAERMRDALVDAVDAGRLPEARLTEAAARATALAGGDVETMTCLDRSLPELVADPAAGSDGGTPPSAGSTPPGATPQGTRTTATSSPTATPTS